jgi:benzoate/toluate 1,2-dioxygenase beta subunit
MNRQDAEDFLFNEARLLDDNDLRAWLDLTDDDFVYWIPVNDPDSDPTRHLSIIYDNKAQCSERIFRILDSGLNHPQDPDSATVRFVSNVQVEPQSAGAVMIRCNTLLYEYRNRAARRDSITLIHHPARCEYSLRDHDGTWLMTQKKVTFIHLDGPLDAMTYFI